jgi:hypothetical protein
MHDSLPLCDQPPPVLNFTSSSMRGSGIRPDHAEASLTACDAVPFLEREGVGESPAVPVPGQPGPSGKRQGTSQFTGFRYSWGECAERTGCEARDARCRSEKRAGTREKQSAHPAPPPPSRARGESRPLESRLASSQSGGSLHQLARAELSAGDPIREAGEEFRTERRVADVWTFAEATVARSTRDPLSLTREL